MTKDCGLVTIHGMKTAKAEMRQEPDKMNIEEVYGLIKDDLSRVEHEFKKSLRSEVYLISKVGEYILKSGGKRFRPSLLLLSARLCDCKDYCHIPLAGMVEFIHTATLLHDDVVDNAKLRRGKVSANSIWGNGASVLIGDFLFSKSFDIMVKDGNMRVLEVMAGTTTYMAEGEILQLMKEGDIGITEDEYTSVILNKTALLISAACRLGAILGKTSLKQENALADFGIELGIAFQLIDDCMDYKSQASEWGKAIGNDLREGKVTMPLIHTLRNCSKEEQEEISRAIEGDYIGEECLKRIIELIDRYKGIEYTENRAREYVDRAKNFLDTFEHCLEKTALYAMADYVIDRRS
ncbi:MAG: polyprenyl synthetase family protein [Thermodesulfobacteriota bacterium]